MIAPMKTEVIKLSPKVAERYAEKAAPNRTTQPLRVKLFVEIIWDGYWELTHQGIAFNSDGQLVDGLHRCRAISLAGITVPIMATWNLPDSALPAIDRGKMRDDTDIANLTAGLPEHLTRNQTAVAKAMAGGFTGSAQDRLLGPRLVKFIVKHFDPLMFVRHHGGSIPAIIKAPVARAWYSEDHDRLAKFLEVVKRGTSESSADVAASLLALRYGQEAKGNMSGAVRASWYRKTECALGFFMAGKKLSMLREVQEERYAIPTDED